MNNNFNVFLIQILELRKYQVVVNGKTVKNEPSLFVRKNYCMHTNQVTVTPYKHDIEINNGGLAWWPCVYMSGFHIERPYWRCSMVAMRLYVWVVVSKDPTGGVA